MLDVLLLISDFTRNLHKMQNFHAFSAERQKARKEEAETKKMTNEMTLFIINMRRDTRDNSGTNELSFIFSFKGEYECPDDQVRQFCHELSREAKQWSQRLSCL
jgi:hypothetical protein